MKKKVTVLIVTLSMAATLFVSSCSLQAVDDFDSSTNSNINATESLKDDESLVLVEDYASDGYNGYEVYADKETGVMYLLVYGHNESGLTVMLNKDGSPKIWDGSYKYNR